MPATLKPNWKLPPPPTCSGGPSCEHPRRPMRATAYLDSDGWALHWYCACGAVSDISAGWPFLEDRARAADLKLAGFDVC